MLENRLKWFTIIGKMVHLCEGYTFLRIMSTYSGISTIYGIHLFAEIAYLA